MNTLLTIYKKSFFLTTLENDSTKLFSIKTFLITSNQNVLVICHEYDLLSFHKHFEAFEVGDKHLNLQIHNIDHFGSQPIHLLRTSHNKKLNWTKKFLEVHLNDEL